MDAFISFDCPNMKTFCSKLKHIIHSTEFYRTLEKFFHSTRGRRWDVLKSDTIGKNFLTLHIFQKVPNLTKTSAITFWDD